jgi:hypothetical protein
VLIGTDHIAAIVVNCGIIYSCTSFSSIFVLLEYTFLSIILLQLNKSFPQFINQSAFNKANNHHPYSAVFLHLFLFLSLLENKFCKNLNHNTKAQPIIMYFHHFLIASTCLGLFLSIRHIFASQSTKMPQSTPFAHHDL